MNLSVYGSPLVTQQHPGDGRRFSLRQPRRIAFVPGPCYLRNEQ